MWLTNRLMGGWVWGWGGSFSSVASTSRSTKVNTCVLKSAPGLGVIGTQASFTESPSSERGAYIETQSSRYFGGARRPQIASPSHLCSSWVFFGFFFAPSATGCCLISTVAQYFPWPPARVYHKCNISTNVSYVPRLCQIYPDARNIRCLLLLSGLLAARTGHNG